jgi:GPH family glycoside/pentoside/hexuronide:cation symporter
MYLAYGSAQAGLSSVEIFVRLHLMIFFTDTLGLSPVAAGWSLALGVMGGALLDPLVGRLSDQSRSRWGRRRAFMLPGGAALVIAIVALFHLHEIDGAGLRFVAASAVFVIYNAAYTVFHIPYMALGGDLARDRHEVTKFFAWRLGLGGIGAVLGASLPLVLQVGFGIRNEESRYSTEGLALAGWVLLTVVGTVASTRENKFAPIAHAPWRREWRDLRANKPLWPYWWCFVVANFALVVNSSVAIYFYRYRLRLDETSINVILASYVAVFLVSLPLWTYLSRRFGKLSALRAGTFALGVIVVVSYPLMPVGCFWIPFAVGVVTGVFSGVIVLMDSILKDIIDYDHLRSRRERAGLHFGVWRIGEKLARGASLLFVGQFLLWIHFAPHRELSEEGSRALATLFGPGVGGLLVITSICLCLYAYGDRRHARVLELLRRRQSPRLKARRS